MYRMRTIVVGDVHGCLDEFRELLNLLSFSEESDRLVQVGDLMDRGPDPIECVRYARKIGAVVIMGNHEEKHVRWRRHEVKRILTGKKNPMKPFSLKRAAQNADLTEEEIEWMSKLPLTYKLESGFVVVHGGLEPAFSVDGQSDAVLRVRYVDEEGKKVGYARGSMKQPENTVYWAEKWGGPESIIYGHARHSLTPRVDKFEEGCCYGIDTGCVFGGRLTAMILTSDGDPEFVQVHARKAYFDSTHCDGDE